VWDHLFVLAVTGDHLSSAARYLSRPSTYRENLLLILFAVVIAAIWTTLLLWDRLRKMQLAVVGPSTSVFEELCQAHQLDPQEIACLHEAAQECGLAMPALLFVQPDHLERLAGDAMPKAGAYRQLRARLFGDLA
jgi:hypothetical protein